MTPIVGKPPPVLGPLVAAACRWTLAISSMKILPIAVATSARNAARRRSSAADEQQLTPRPSGANDGARDGDGPAPRIPEPPCYASTLRGFSPPPARPEAAGRGAPVEPGSAGSPAPFKDGGLAFGCHRGSRRWCDGVELSLMSPSAACVWLLRRAHATPR